MSEILQHLEKLANGFEVFKGNNDKRFTDLERQNDEIEKQLGRGSLGAGGPSAGGDRQGFNNALRGFLRTGNQGPLAEFSIKNQMTVGSDPSGGYTVLPQLDDGISQILRDISPFRRVARIKSVQQADAHEERYSIDAAGTSWVGETATRGTTTQPDIKKLRVPLFELFAQPEASQKLLDTSDSDIVGWLTEQVGIGFAEAEGTAFITGTGVAQPRGLLTYATAATADSARAWEVLEHIPSGNASGFAATEAEDALINMVSALKVGYRQRAVWMMNRQTAGTISKFKDSQNRPIWTDGLQAGVPPTLLGFAVVLNEDFPAVAANNFPVALADFSQAYTIADKPGQKLLLDPYTNKPFVRVYVYKRVGGDVRNFHSCKLLKISTS